MASRRPSPGSAARIAGVFAFLVLAATAAASPAPVAVDLGVVLATNERSAPDPALSALRGTLESMFPYTSYRLLDRRKRSLPVGETGDFPLPGGRSMRVTPVPAEGDRVRLAVQVMEGQRNLVTTTLALRRGGMVLLAVPRGGSAPPGRGGDAQGLMILILSAE